MKPKFLFLKITLLVTLFSVSCVKKQTREDIADNLKTTFDIYLNHQPQIDTSRVKFKVLEVSFFEAKLGYICNFKVNMKEKRKGILTDTTGFMNANVSKDFKEVSRRD